MDGQSSTVENMTGLPEGNIPPASLELLDKFEQIGENSGNQAKSDENLEISQSSGRVDPHGDLAGKIKQMDAWDAQDQEENSNEGLDARTGYLNLVDNGLQAYPTGELAKMIFSENGPEKRPIHLYRVRNSLKMIFGARAIRDRVVKDRLVLNAIRCMVSPPNPRLDMKTMAIYGLSVEEPEKSVREFLERKGLKVMGFQRWARYKGTTISSTGRLFRVAIPPGCEIPGYAIYRSTAYSMGKKVNIWYPGLAIWCRSCLEKGHFSYQCKQRETQQEGQAATYRENYPEVTGVVPTGAFNPDIGDTAEVLDPGISAEEEGVSGTDAGGRLQGENQGEEKEGLTGEAMEASEGVTSDGYDEGAQSGKMSWSKIQEGEKVGEGTSCDQFLPPSLFYSQGTSLGELSNFYKANMVIKGKRYASVEQYIQYRRANHMDDKKAMEAIMGTNDGKSIKQIGKAIGFKGDWHSFARLVMLEGMKAKFSQNPTLRALLFGTADRRLGEASRDNYWGIGYAADDPDAKDFNNWTGENTCGKVLMAVREALMADRKFAAETKQIELSKTKKRFSSNWDITLKHRRTGKL